MEALEAVSREGDARVLEALVERLQDVDPSVRALAVGGRLISGADAHLSRCAILAVWGRGTTAGSKVDPDPPCRL